MLPTDRNSGKDEIRQRESILGYGPACFYAEYRLNKILQPLVGEISWSKHIVILTKCKEIQQWQFYILAIKKYGWTKVVPINKIETKTCENYLLDQSNFDMTFIC